MSIIPPINPIFYLAGFLVFLLLVLTLIALIKSTRARRGKVLFLSCAFGLQVVTIVYPIYLYSNKTAPLSSSHLLICTNQNGRIVALDARDGSVRWTQSPRGIYTLVTDGPGKVFYAASQTNDGGSVITASTASSGTQVWHTTLLPPHSYGKLEHLMTADGFVYVDEAVGVSDEVVYALHINDGCLAWQHTEHLAGELGDSLQPLLITTGNSFFLCVHRRVVSPHYMQTMAH